MFEYFVIFGICRGNCRDCRTENCFAPIFIASERGDRDESFAAPIDLSKSMGSKINSAQSELFGSWQGAQSLLLKFKTLPEPLYKL